MNRCARNGYLVDATHELPTDPTDLYVEDLPVVGCSNVQCERCGAVARNAPGLAFRTRAEVSVTQLTALYASPDLAASPLLHQTGRDWRLYLCKCHRWLETRHHALAEPDLDVLTDPTMPWSCRGHPSIALPHELDGIVVKSQTELRELAVRGCHGFSPPQTRAADKVCAYWLARLQARLEARDAVIVVAAVVACLDDPDPRSRALAIHFFYRVPDRQGQARLLEILDGDRRLFARIPDEVTVIEVDKTLEASIWRALAPLVGEPGRARELARAEALSGTASLAVYHALARGDSAWFTSHVEDLARAAPGREDLLLASFTQLPRGIPVRELCERVRPSYPEPPKATTLDEALAYRGRPVAAWDYKSRGRARLCVYDVGTFVAKLLACKELPSDERAAMTERIRKRGLRIGGTHGDRSYVWVTGEEGVAVWSDTTLLAHGKATEFTVGTNKVRASDVTEVRTFVGSGAGRRGVSLVLAGGNAVVIVEEHDTGATEDLEWAFYLGQDLARWLGVPHRGYTGKIVAEDEQ